MEEEENEDDGDDMEDNEEPEEEVGLLVYSLLGISISRALSLSLSGSKDD